MSADRHTTPTLQSCDASMLPEALRSLLDELPLLEAMPELLPRSSASKEAHRLAESAKEGLPPELQAGIWLYVDDLDRSHSISQALHTPTGSFWHAIMHRREGDFGNSRYWLRMAGSHPVWNEIPGYEPFEFVDRVAAARGTNPPDLVELQRREWWELMKWCAEACSSPLAGEAGRG